MKLILQSVEKDPVIDLAELRHHFLLRRKETDQYLSEVLNLAINVIEKRSGLSIRKKIWNIIHNNCYIHLINGPIRNIISMTSKVTKEDVKPIEYIRNGENVYLLFDDSIGYVSVVYETGYDINNLPICLKNSIIESFWELYELNEQKLEDDVIKYRDINDYRFDYARSRL